MPATKARRSLALTAWAASGLLLAGCGGGDGEQPLSPGAAPPAAISPTDTTSAPPAATTSTGPTEPTRPTQPTEPTGPTGPTEPATGEAGEPPASPRATASPTASPTPTPVATDPAASDVREVTVEIADGKVNPPPSGVNVTKGTTVALTVTSDVPDELHVHGYDLEGALVPGEPRRLEFIADQTGSFDVETHESGLVLLRLRVR